MVKFFFRKAIESDVVLLYPNREDIVRDYILKEIPYQVVDVGMLCLHPLILMRTMKLLKSVRLSLIFSLRPSFTNFIKEIYELHIQAYIEAIAPKVVLTFIDDSGVFQRLSRRCQAPEFFAIQNGMRLDFHYDIFLPNPSSLANIISMPNYFCFGHYDVETSTEKGSRIDNYFPIGSLIGGVYWGEVSTEIEPIYDICYISSFVSTPESGVKEKAHLDLWRADTEGARALESNLKRLISEKGYSVIVAMKYDNSLEEESYFYSIFGDTVTYQRSSRVDFSAYRAIDKSRLSLTGYSTCATEALGMGRRALFVNSLSYAPCSMQAAEFCYLEGQNYNEFSNRIDTVLAMSNVEYDNLMSESKKYLMNYDVNDFAHNKIRRIIMSALTN